MRELFSKERVTEFLRADGQKMVNGKGEQVILRGWGMGNWDNPEGFMIGAADDFDLSFGHAPMGCIDRGRSLRADRPGDLRQQVFRDFLGPLAPRLAERGRYQATGGAGHQLLGLYAESPGYYSQEQRTCRNWIFANYLKDGRPL